MHARGGFEQDTLLDDAWGVTVDMVCVAIMLWIATGLYMWWHQPGTRGWGWIALAGGTSMFAIFLMTL